jgi:hypothetical protein
MDSNSLNSSSSSTKSSILADHDAIINDTGEIHLSQYTDRNEEEFIPSTTKNYNKSNTTFEAFGLGQLSEDINSDSDNGIYKTSNTNTQSKPNKDKEKSTLSSTFKTAAGTDITNQKQRLKRKLVKTPYKPPSAFKKFQKHPPQDARTSNALSELRRSLFIKETEKEAEEVPVNINNATVSDHVAEEDTSEEEEDDDNYAILELKRLLEEYDKRKKDNDTHRQNENENGSEENSDVEFMGRSSRETSASTDNTEHLKDSNKELDSQLDKSTNIHDYYTEEAITPSSRKTVLNPYLHNKGKRVTPNHMNNPFHHPPPPPPIPTPLPNNFHIDTNLSNPTDTLKGSYLTTNPNTILPTTTNNTCVLKAIDLIGEHSLNLNKQASMDPNRKVDLNSELEPLRETILSQHNALEKHIKELGHLCLHFTKLITKKKESSAKLIHEDIIPRSLKIKCELTTSPSYENSPFYLEFKQELQAAVTDFTNKGLSIMKKWSIHNIQLLTRDRCNTVLKKALYILEGIYSFRSDILGPITPTNRDSDKQALLLLIKIFFTTDFSSAIDDIAVFLDTSKDDMLIISTKIITNQTDEYLNLRSIELIDINMINKKNKNQTTVIVETLTAFEEILKATTVTLWEANLHNTRLLEATQRFKAKMDSEPIASATVATSRAIQNALEATEENTSQNQINQLRFQKLEKQLLHQKQISNELINHIKKQKNSKGSQRGLLTSPPKKPNPQSNFIDLTSNQSQSPENNYQLSSHNKKVNQVKWDNSHSEIQYNPLSTPIQTFARSQTLNPFNSALTSANQAHTTTPKIPLNPFQSLTSNHTRNYRGGRSRGGRRGFSRRK